MFVIQEKFVDIRFDEENVVFGVRNCTCQVAECLTNTLLSYNTVVLDNFVERFGTLGMVIVCFHPPVNRLLNMSENLMHITEFKGGVKDFFNPAAGFKSLLIPFRRLGVPTKITVTIGEIEHITDIAWLVFQTLAEKAYITLKLIGLGTTVANILNDE